MPTEPGYVCKHGQNARCAADYQVRLSGPLIDRIDLHVEVPAVTAADLILPPPAEGSREVAERVARARALQAARYAAAGAPHIRCNAAADGPLLEEVARPDAGGLTLLRDATDAMHLSARGYHRVLRVARTLADLDGSREGRPRASGRGLVLPGAGRRDAPRRVRHCRSYFRRLARTFSQAAIPACAKVSSWLVPAMPTPPTSLPSTTSGMPPPTR